MTILETVSKQEEKNKSFVTKKTLKNYSADFYDYEIAEKRYAEYLSSGKKTVDMKDLAKELGIKLNHYK
jgi:hypothetical protein